MDCCGRDEQGRSGDEHEADDGLGRRTPCADESPGSNFTVDGHAAFTHPPGGYVRGWYRDCAQTVQG